ncbi:MAG: hypothetical protein KJZ69_15275 [Phycisphaerales bacterium]|nr:hypothetical protein [Phycisphaerales bacterium]
MTVLFGGGPEPHGDTWEWDGARWRERDTQQLPHADLPNEPGTGTTFTRWTRDGGEERNIPFVAIKWNRPTAVLIHGWNSQGYLPREEATYWIRQFKDVATDKITGAFRGQQGEAGAQIVVIDWNDRADPLWGYTNRDIWLSARNGYADGQLIGRALSELPTQDVDADRLHLIGHSNGSAFAAGIAFSFHELTGRAIGQLTAIEAPSEAEMNVPTGVFVQNASAVVQYFENWAYSGENPGEVGEQMWGGNTTNILASISHTFEITIDRAYYLLHSKLPLRYARSARYGLSYSESSFTDHSVTLGWTPLAPGVWRELNTNRWRFEGEPRWHPAERLRRGFTFESDPLSWRGQNAWHIGGPGELAFRCDGTGDLYVEFVIQPDEMSEGWTNLMTWELRVLEPFYKPVYVFCDDEYVGSVEVNGQTGFFPIQRTLLAYQLSEHPIKIGFWVPNDNGQSRAFEIGYVGIYETNYYITGN